MSPMLLIWQHTQGHDWVTLISAGFGELILVRFASFTTARRMPETQVMSQQVSHFLVRHQRQQPGNCLGL